MGSYNKENKNKNSMNDLKNILIGLLVLNAILVLLYSFVVFFVRKDDKKDHLIFFIFLVIVALNWIVFYGEKIYTIMNFIATVPSVLTPLFVPALMKRVPIPVLLYANAIFQSLCCFFYMFSPTFNIAVWAKIGLTLIVVFLSSAFFAMTQTILFRVSDEIKDTVEYLLIGLSAANLLLSFAFKPIIQFVQSFFTRQKYFYILPLGLQVLSAPLYMILFKKYPQNLRSNAKNPWNILLKAFKNRFFILSMNIITFFDTFMMYPTFMFMMDDSSTNMMIFGVTEVAARVLNLVFGRCTNKYFDKKGVYILVAVRHFAILFIFVTYFGTINLFYISPTAIKWMNRTIYGFSAFSLGILGNNIVLLVFGDNLAKEHSSAASALYASSISFSILLGSFVASCITWVM